MNNLTVIFNAASLIFSKNRFGAILQFVATLQVYGRRFNCGDGLSRDTVRLFLLGRVFEINSIIVGFKLGYVHANNTLISDITCNVNPCTSLSLVYILKVYQLRILYVYYTLASEAN